MKFLVMFLLASPVLAQTLTAEQIAALKEIQANYGGSLQQIQKADTKKAVETQRREDQPAETESETR